MTVDSVRGAGTARAGATDTTMLIWKTIKANPGITREQLWEKVEHGIPDGYALRRFNRDARDSIRLANDSGSRITSARRYVFAKTLASMKYLGTVVMVDGCYSALRSPHYRGNPEVIDLDGSKAAEHMAIAAALRVAEKAIAQPYKRHASGAIRSRELYEAVTVMVKALRDKGSSA